MKNRGLIAKKAILCLALLSALSPAVFAYLDPGIGTLILNSVIAAVVTAAVTVGLWWKKFVGFIKKLFSGKKR